MATLNQFQQYSQGENTITNNVLLMFSSIYEINPRYFEEYINSLIEDSNYEVIPSFVQQVGNRGDGIIDGYISTKATSIIIETKIHGLEWIEKLLKYTKSFNENEHKILLHLSSDKYQHKEVIKIQERLESEPLTKGARFFSITFANLSDQLESLSSIYPYEPHLTRLASNFKVYCQNMNLLPRSRHVLRAMACGQSYELNIKHRFYFDAARRGFSHFDYLGIYWWKSVRYIGTVENEMEADWSEEEGLMVKYSRYDVTEDQKQRLVIAIKESLAKEWDIDYGSRFFLLKDFYETDFKKTSPGGIFRVRYFDLDAVLPKECLGSVKEIADELRNREWEEWD